MRKVYFPLSTDCLYVETEGSFLAASGVAECVITPVNVTVNSFENGGTEDVTIGDINFD